MKPEIILEAIRARINGEWDNPCLEMMGALRPDPLNDILAWCEESTRPCNCAHPERVICEEEKPGDWIPPAWETCGCEICALRRAAERRKRS